MEQSRYGAGTEYNTVIIDLGWSRHSDWRRGSSSQDMEQVDSTEMELGWSNNCD